MPMTEPEIIIIDIIMSQVSINLFTHLTRNKIKMKKNKISFKNTFIFRKEGGKQTFKKKTFILFTNTLPAEP